MEKIVLEKQISGRQIFKVNLVAIVFLSIWLNLGLFTLIAAGIFAPTVETLFRQGLDSTILNFVLTFVIFWASIWALFKINKLLNIPPMFNLRTSASLNTIIGWLSASAIFFLIICSRAFQTLYETMW